MKYGQFSKIVFWATLFLVCISIIQIYAKIAMSGPWEIGNNDPKESTYNLLVDGLRSGHLSLKKDTPPGLGRLQNPYDPSANAVYRDQYGGYRLHDTSFYKGKLYIYFGVVPALILFLPAIVVMHCYLFHWEAAVIFCAIGFMLYAVLLLDIKRTYYNSVHNGVLILLLAAVGLSSGVPPLLSRADIWEVPIACEYMLTALMLLSAWYVIHRSEYKLCWLAAVSLSCGLLIGVRPPALLDDAILIALAIFCIRHGKRQPLWKLIYCAVIPVITCYIFVAIYNYIRFDSPFEFGQKYQMAGVNVGNMQIFSMRYFITNIHIYFFSSPQWIKFWYFNSPQNSIMWLPKGYMNIEHTFGVLTNVPVIWLMLGLPLAFTKRSKSQSDPFRTFCMMVAWVGISELIFLCFFMGAAGRYEAEFLPSFVLLSSIAILSIEYAGITPLVWRTIWGVLLLFSVCFNLIYGIDHIDHQTIGRTLLLEGRPVFAIRELHKALECTPHNAEVHNELGVALAISGDNKEAEKFFILAIKGDPNDIRPRLNLMKLRHITSLARFNLEYQAEFTQP